MSFGVKVVSASLCAAFLLMTGCAVPIQVSRQDQSDAAPWRGRLAVRIESDQAHSFSAGFELSGNPQVGELTLYTPLGNTAASLSWTTQSAMMRRAGETHHFSSLAALMAQALGAEIPVAALFSWLAGDGVAAAGWSADLSHHATGRITARRIVPAPAAELRLVLDQ